MAVDEGGVRSGGLSDYVSDQKRRLFSETELAEATRKEAVLKEALEKQKQMDIYIQQLNPLRAHLQKLIAPIEELLSYFHAKELLEEFLMVYWPSGSVKPLEPSIYRDVVSNPDPTKTSFTVEEVGEKNGKWEFGSSTVDLSQIADPINLQLLIPRLDGYGLKLTDSDIKYRTKDGTKGMWIPLASNPWAYPGVKSVASSGPEGHYIRIRTEESYSEIFIKEASIRSVKSELDDHEYDLIYHSQILLHSSPYKIIKPTRIRADQPDDALKKVIGDVIVNHGASIY